MRPEHGGQDAGKLDGRQEMIRRRGFLGGLLAAPIAASISQNEYMPTTKYAGSSDIAKMVGINKYPSKADRLLEEVKEARVMSMICAHLTSMPERPQVRR